MLTTTVSRMTILTCSGVPADRNLSAMVTPRILAVWALATI